LKSAAPSMAEYPTSAEDDFEALQTNMGFIH
jgi:hypothetical protein